MKPGAQRFVLSETNPNQSGACLCSPHSIHEDSSGPFVVFQAAEVEGTPGNYNAVACYGCVCAAAEQLAAPAGEADLLRLGEGDTPKHHRAPAGGLVGFPTGRPEPSEPPRHVNPSADTLEEATDLLDREALARLEDNGGPVI